MRVVRVNNRSVYTVKIRDRSNPELLISSSYYRAHTKYDAKVMFSAFLSFCPQGGEGGGKN